MMIWIRAICLLIVGVLASDAGEPAAAFKKISASGITNFFQLSARIYSGAQPEGDGAFETLRNLGIRTIVSVDGSSPDMERAHRYGMRYVHIPIGYDGVSATNRLKLVKAAYTLEGPVFVHCHHGMHRGPAAAAILCLSTEHWSPSDGVRWLKTAGTDPNFPGLYKSVEKFEMPAPGDLAKVSAQFPERVAPPAIIEAMVRLDVTWDKIKSHRSAGWDTGPKGWLDDGMQLVEHFRELQRLPEAKLKGSKFIELAGVAELAAGSFCTLAPDATAPKREQYFNALSRSCVACHKQFRN